MEDRLEKLERICKGLANQIQSPHDSRVEEALWLILEELKTVRSALVGAYLVPMTQPKGTT